MSKISKLDKVIEGAKNGTTEDLLRQNLIKFCCPGEFGIEEACDIGKDCENCWNEPLQEARIDEIKEEISNLKWAIETIRDEGYSKDMEAVWRILDKLKKNRESAIIRCDACGSEMVREERIPFTQTYICEDCGVWWENKG